MTDYKVTWSRVCGITGAGERKDCLFVSVHCDNTYLKQAVNKALAEEPDLLVVVKE